MTAPPRRLLARQPGPRVGLAVGPRNDGRVPPDGRIPARVDDEGNVRFGPGTRFRRIWILQPSIWVGYFRSVIIVELVELVRLGVLETALLFGESGQTSSKKKEKQRFHQGKERIAAGRKVESD